MTILYNIHAIHTSFYHHISTVSFHLKMVITVHHWEGCHSSSPIRRRLNQCSFLSFFKLCHPKGHKDKLRQELVQNEGRFLCPFNLAFFRSLKGFAIRKSQLKISIRIKSLGASDEIGSMSSMGTFAAGFPLLNTASCQVSKKKHESLQVSADAHLHDLHVVETIHACIASGFFCRFRNEEFRHAFQAAKPMPSQAPKSRLSPPKRRLSCRSSS